VLRATFRATKKANSGIPDKISVFAAINAFDAMLAHNGGPMSTHEIDGASLPHELHVLNHLVEEALIFRR
jgi:hypothetical protein